MGTASEKFCLRWNDFESNISVAFRELREEKDFFDVTLACDDSQIQAHKVILSACSPFFRNVLRRNPHQHPLLYLKGVKYKDILSVLNFMYMGEVNVAQEELNSFLSVAEDLRVKGLTQNNTTSEPPTPKVLTKPELPKHIIRPRDPPERDPIAPPPKRPRPSAPIHSFRSEDDDIQEVVPVKSEPRDPVPPMAMPVAPIEPQLYQQHHTQEEDMVGEQGHGTAVALDENYGDESYDYGQYGEGYDDGSGMVDHSGMVLGGPDGNKGSVTFEELDVMIQLKTVRIGKDFKCTDCDYETKMKCNLEKHIEAKHISPGVACQFCNKICPTRHALRMHLSRNHNALPMHQ